MESAMVKVQLGFYEIMGTCKRLRKVFCSNWYLGHISKGKEKLFRLKQVWGVLFRESKNLREDCDGKQHNASSELLWYYCSMKYTPWSDERWRQRDRERTRLWWHVQCRYDKKPLNDFYKGNEARFAFCIYI